MKDSLDRRIRWAEPQPQVKRLVLTDADFLIFECINRHGPLPTPFLYRFTRHLRKDYSHLQNRLTELYNGDDGGPYLVRPPRQFASFHARYSHMVYDLSKRAKALLETPVAMRKDPFVHQLMKACVGASIEAQAEEIGIQYVPRHELNLQEGTIIPDDVFSLHYNGKNHFFALEVDRNTESIERTTQGYNTVTKKIQNYISAFEAKDLLGLRNWSVLIVTTNHTHAKNILAKIAEQDSRFAGKFALYVLPDFAANWRVPKGLSKLLEEPWHTVDGEIKLVLPLNGESRV